MPRRGLAGYRGEKKECAYGPCRKVFVPRAPWAKYCSDLCRVSDFYYRKTLKRLKHLKGVKANPKS
jgi:hypothetical protein